VPVPAQTGKTAGTSTTGQAGPSAGSDTNSLQKALDMGSSSSAPPRTSTTGTSTRDFSFVWDMPDEGKDRELVSGKIPELPRRVREEGLILRMVLAFIVAPDGVVVQARVTQSSGYADVDAAVLAAVRTWQFSRAETTRNASGTIPYTVRPR
jgi:TonB family protein